MVGLDCGGRGHVEWCRRKNWCLDCRKGVLGCDGGGIAPGLIILTLGSSVFVLAPGLIIVSLGSSLAVRRCGCLLVAASIGQRTRGEPCTS